MKELEGKSPSKESQSPESYGGEIGMAGASIPGFTDNRPEAIAQRKLQDSANASPIVQQLQAVQKVANSRPQAQGFQSVQRKAVAGGAVQRVEGKDGEKKAPSSKETGEKNQEQKQTSETKEAIENPGAYLGYTHGGELPTLYFENGHFTQAHQNPKNVGWHPNKGDRHVIKNITEEKHKEYGDHRGGPGAWSAEKKAEFAKSVDKGEYDAKEGEGKMFESNVKVEDGKDQYSGNHPSRARLVQVGEEGFKAAYGKAYAESVLAKGEVAQNEKS